MEPVFQTAQALRQLNQKLAGLIQAGRISQFSDNHAQIAINDELAENDVLYVEPFGLTGSPVQGTGVVLFSPPQSGKKLCLSLRPQYKRPPLKEGETALYNAHGAKIELKKDGRIRIGNSSTELLSTLSELVSQIQALSRQIATLTSPSGPCRSTLPAPSFDSVRTSLEALKG